ncbi:DUF2236 domain-containing protein [Cyclobacteriaceae bacterium]|nr:DUF2236 domain-containing protein [Cyclobacteriaceae bacterium]
MNNLSPSIESLNQFRSLADPHTDQIVEKIHQEGRRDVLELFKKLDKNSDLVGPEFPNYIQEYFNNQEVPTWVNWDKIKLAQQVFSKYGDAISMLLFFKALPTCYCCAKGAKVMYKTQRFVQDHNERFDTFTKRLVETAQYVINILSPNGFETDEKGLITAKKVRLIHSTIRYYILKNNDWNKEEDGIPINQEDLTGTLLSFSSLIIEGLEQTGINLSQEEKEAYIHVWRYAGYLNGIEDELLPTSYQHAVTLQKAILTHQVAYSLEGKELIDSLIKYIEYVIPGNLFDGFAIIMVRHYMGDQYADLMQVPHEKELISKVTTKLVSLSFDTKEDLMNSSLIARSFFKKVNKLFLQGMLSYYNEFEEVHFYLPKSLQTDWKVASWDTVVSTPTLGSYRLAIQKKISDTTE